MLKRILLLLFTTLVVATASAYDFKVDGLAYFKNSDSTSVFVASDRAESSSVSYPTLSGEITIPPTVTYGGKTYDVTAIGGDAFYGSNLSKVNMPNSIISIGRWAFYNCSLNSITIPNSVKSIGERAFNNCYSLRDITIGNSIDTIDYYAFEKCTNLKEVHIADIDSWCNISFAYGSNPLFNANHLYINGVEITNLVIPNTVNTIKQRAFGGCLGLTSVTIPNSVTSIGERAFYSCKNLKTVTISGSVISIGSDAFRDCGQNATFVLLGTTPPTLKGLLSDNYKQNYKEDKIYVPYFEVSDYQSAWYSNYQYVGGVRINGLIEVEKYASFVVFTPLKNISEMISVTCKGKTYTPNADGSIRVNGLTPGDEYEFVARYKSNFSDEIVTDQGTLSTNDWSCESMSQSTQTSITPRFRINGIWADDIKPSDVWYIRDGKKYMPTKVIDDVAFEFDEIKGLKPSQEIIITVHAIINGSEYTDEYWLVTKSTRENMDMNDCELTPTAIRPNGKYTGSSIKIIDEYYKLESTQFTDIITGLKPQTAYKVFYYMKSEYDGNWYNSVSNTFTTPALRMTTQAAQMLDNRTPLFEAQTNLADEETSCGFEWRRYDAPEEMPSTQVYCPVYDGVMCGTLQNLAENVYYKYRPFYKASDGTMYYGDWIAFITADAGVYFEPRVHTYSACTVNADNSASISGMAIRGSETIAEQGFMYWPSSGASHVPGRLAAPASGAQKVTASGQRMTATLTGLKPGATYLYCAYVKSASGTMTYGEDRSIHLLGPTGDLNDDGSVNTGDVSALYRAVLNGNTDGLYDLNGDGSVNTGDVSALYKLILGN